jgi:hypothetical protein
MQHKRHRDEIRSISLLGFVLLISISLLTAGVPQARDKKTSDKSSTPDTPTQVTLHKFEVFHIDNLISLEWQSSYELDNLGYNVYSERNGVRVQLNPSLIAGSALQTRQGVPMMAGNTYAWRGKFAEGEERGSTTFWLESINLSLQSTWYGPVHAKAGDPSVARPRQSKLLSDFSAEPDNPQQSERPAPLKSSLRKIYRNWNEVDVSTLMTLDKQTKPLNSVLSAEVTSGPNPQWDIAAQEAVKIHVNRDGWQRVTRPELLSAGLSPTANLTNLKLFLDGVEHAIIVNGDGSIEFYGRALHTQTTDTRVYWLVVGVTPGKRVDVLSGGPFDPNVQPSSFPSTVERKDRTIRFPGLLNGPGDNYFGPTVSTVPIRQTLQVTSLDQTGSQAQLEVGVQGLSNQNHQVRVQINGVEVGIITFTDRNSGFGQFSVSPSLLRENKNSIQLTSMAPGSDVSLMDFVRLTYPRKYEASSNRLHFSVPGGQSVKVRGFGTSNLRVLDVTDEANIDELTVSPQAEGGTFAFTLPAVASQRTILAIGASANFDHPKEVSRNLPSSWHLPVNGADLLIITHSNFRQSLEPLRLLRESQGLQVTIVDIEDVYDEFSFGAHTPLAVKNFLQLARQSWQATPDYLLLVGDGTADPRDILAVGSKDYVPTMMVDGAFSESPSDSMLVDFDADGIEDLPIGRLPVGTAQETALVVNKILTYEQSAAGNTQSRGAVMVSDSFDGIYDFEAFTADVRTSLPPLMTVQFINRSAGDTATIRGQIMSAINLGPGVVNYLGHGSVGVWTGVALLEVKDANNFTNDQQFSIFVMMTCLNGAFTEVGTDSLGEAILKAPTGGGAAVWASTGLTVPYGQVAISKEFYTRLFTGQSLRVGDAAKLAKLATVDMDIRRLSIFFGDPSMRFR